MNIKFLQLKSTSVLFQFIIVFTVIIFSLFFFSHNSSAQNSDNLLVSWQAQNYAPLEFTGKILPTRETTIELGVDLLVNGKIVDLSKHSIRWLVNNEEEALGTGLQSISFTFPAHVGGEQRVKAVVLNYRGEDLEKTISVPVVDPEVIIRSTVQNKTIAPGEVEFHALPYFFNVTSLQDIFLQWQANGVKTTANTPILVLDLSDAPSGDVLNLSLNALNFKNDIEQARSSLRFTIQ